MDSPESKPKGQAGDYIGDYERLSRLISLQGLDGFCRLNKLDLTKELGSFFAEHPWMRFKCIFLDCSLKDVMQSSLEHFWPRLVPNGVLILDHYNLETSPDESSIIDDFSGGAAMHQVPYTRSPTAYVIKPAVSSQAME